jgi:hypothetical protein
MRFALCVLACAGVAALSAAPAAADVKINLEEVRVRADASVGDGFDSGWQRP